MKKLFIAALLAATLTTSSFATDESKINTRIRENFKMDFKGADKVDWTLRPDFVKASFTLNGERVSAFYDYKGDMIGSSRHITVEDLPLKAKRIFAKSYSDYAVTEAVEYEGTEESAFYVSAENDKETLILKITDSGSLSVFMKTRKN